MKITLLEITPNAEKLIEKAARNCYKSEDKITDDSYKIFVPKIIKRQHESILEHAFATFEILGISRACSHQIVRHRLASFSQKSQRYVAESGFNFIRPETIYNDQRAREKYESTMEKILRTYEELLSLGIKKQDARYVLPNACTTDIVMSANYREWRHIFKMRCHKAAQLEIREMALEILRILNSKAPVVFGDLAKEFLEEDNKNVD